MCSVCIRVYLFIKYYALLFHNFNHLLLNNMHCYGYYIVLQPAGGCLLAMGSMIYKEISRCNNAL